MSANPSRDSIQAPTGTVTFLFSDIEGSTRLLERLGDRYPPVLQQHREALRNAFAAHSGVERGTEGDSFFVAFANAGAAVAAAVAATRNLAAVEWPDAQAVRVRIGLHTGEGRLVEEDYVGMDVHRAARIAAAGHGGQVLASQSTQILVERSLPPGVSLRDMGEHRLKDLPAPEHIYQLVIEGQPSEFPPLRSVARTVVNLPALLTSIVGREDEVATVRGLLRESRLVTVTGAGGTGKTRLVQEVARAVVADDPIDAAFVPLEALAEATLIPIEILRSLRLDIAEARDPLDRLAQHLAERRTLLVLDNLEQLSGAASVVRSLLDRAPSLSILASSQAALHLSGEQEFALDPLTVPGATRVSAAVDLGMVADNPAVRLFVERARAVRADFRLDASNASAIVAICVHLDGLPLALELAAAQVKLLSPDAILERIESRPDSLASRRDDLPVRQRTLRATVAWSYDLLPEAEKRLFRRLAAFVGGARLGEIEAMALVQPEVPDPVAALETLVDRSLVRVRRTPGSEDRYVLLETMRSHGRELLRELGEDGVTSARHAAIYADLARRAEPEYYGLARRAWLDRIADEHDNLRAALEELAAAGDLTAALELAADLWRFWQARGHLTEGRERLDALLEAAGAPGAPPITEIAMSRAEEAAGGIRYWTQPDRVAPRAFYERSLEHALASGDRRREAWARYNLAFVFDFVPEARGLGQPDTVRANELRTQALEMFRELGDRRGIVESLWAMGGNSLVMLQDPALARRTLEEAIPALEEIGDVYGMGWAQTSMAMLDAMEGHIDKAEEGVLEAADLFRRHGETAGEIVTVQALGSLAGLRGDPATAVRLGAAAEKAAAEIGGALPRIPPIVDPIDAAAASLAPDDLKREREIGMAIGAKSILSTALEAWHAERGDRDEAAGQVGAAP